VTTLNPTESESAHIAALTGYEPAVDIFEAQFPAPLRFQDDEGPQEEQLIRTENPLPAAEPIKASETTLL